MLDVILNCSIFLVLNTQKSLIGNPSIPVTFDLSSNQDILPNIVPVDDEMGEY
jgi:hypothetical protein